MAPKRTPSPSPNPRPTPRPTEPKTPEQIRNEARAKAGAAEAKQNASIAAGKAADAARLQAQGNAVGANIPKGPGTTVVTKLPTGNTGSTGSVSVVPPVVDPLIMAQLDALRAENALLKSNKDAATAAQRQSAFDLLRKYAEDYDMPASIADRLIDLVANQGYTGTAITLELQNTPEFKERFAGIEAYKKAFASDIASGKKAAAPTPSDYINLERNYQTVLTKYGLGELASRDTYSKLIGGDVSLAEVTDRVANVYDRVMNADDVLKQQLTQYFPTLGATDFAKTLLTGTSPADMAGQLQRKLASAEISSEAARAGLTTGVERAQELQAMGVSRSLARTGYSKIAEQKTGLERLGSIYQQDVTGLQTELEAEQFQGLASQRRRKLTEQEKSSFSGRAGTSQSSLSGGTKGMF
jgi:hypothetical protein